MRRAAAMHDARQDLTAYFAALLRLPADRIATDTNLLDLGADSIMLIEAQRHAETRFGLSIPIQRFFECDRNTIDRLAAHIRDTATAPVPVQGIEDDAARAARFAPPRRSPEPPSSVRALMQAQLALAAETIEAQNRLLLQRRRSARQTKTSELPR